MAEQVRGEDIVIGEIYPAMIGTDWCRVPAYNWRQYDMLYIGVYSQLIPVRTRKLEEYAWGMKDATIGTAAFYLGENRVGYVDIKPIVNQLTATDIDLLETDKYISPNHLEVKMATASAPRPIRLKIMGANPRPLLALNHAKHDSKMWTKPRVETKGTFSASVELPPLTQDEKDRLVHTYKGFFCDPKIDFGFREAHDVVRIHNLTKDEVKHVSGITAQFVEEMR